MDRIPLYRLILWAGPRKESEDEQVARVQRIVDTLREYHPSIWPRYETAWSKHKAREYDFAEARTREIIRRSADKTSPDLGSVFGFFSDMDDDRTAGISFNTGLSAPDTTNSFVLKFPLEPPLNSQDTPFPPPVVEELFKRCVEIWQPYWGAVADRVNDDRFSGLSPKPIPGGKLPVSVRWINFFGGPLASFVGHRRFQRLRGGRLEPFGDGMLLVLQDEPFDDGNLEHLQRQQEANRVLGLPGAGVQ